MTATMADVAREAGVNKGTVSRALRGDPRISETTRARVWQAAHALGYRLNRSGRSLSTARSFLAGVLFEDIAYEWVGSFLAGLDRVFSSSGFEIVVKNAKDSASSTPRARRELELLLCRKVDGIVWLASDPPPPLPFPVVTVGTRRNPYDVSILLESDLAGHAREDGFGFYVFEIGTLCARLLVNRIQGKHLPSDQIHMPPYYGPVKD